MMLTFVNGNLFDFDAKVRINTVNCVGVMGKGVALAFKERFPAMFKDYKQACETGDVKPGQLHVWRELDGTVIVNFPTKRHWREKSRYEDIEDGLRALQKFLQTEGNVRVTLPALGCGHGGLDWKRVSTMIRDYLDNVAAEIFVFNPSASRNVDAAVQIGGDEKTQQLLADAGVTKLTTTDGTIPKQLADLKFDSAFALGRTDLLNEPFVSFLCSNDPTDREIKAAVLCAEELAKANVTIGTGLGAKVERKLIRAALERLGKVIVSIPNGILEFKVPRELQDIWDEERITVMSVCNPHQKWSAGGARSGTLAMIGLSESVLIADEDAKRWKTIVASALKVSPLHVSFIDYQQNGSDLTAMKSIQAVPIRRNKDSGKPNVNAIIERSVGVPVLANAKFDIHETMQPLKDQAVKKNSAMRYPKRLIEVDLPIARISAHARREKSIRHGHISTLHIWWARRPLAACRAVICASLWPDPADELCPPAFRAAAVEQIKQFANRVFPKGVTEEGRMLSSEKHLSMESRGRWEAIAKGTLTLDADEPADMEALRLCLLDFIADFANWDNSTVPAFLETSRALTQAAHEALGGAIGTKPLVVDPFAGGGSIPLEALRVGADAFASDLNPIPVLLNKVVLEYIPKYGKTLAEEVRKWGQWVKVEAEKELGEFYSKDPEGGIPIAYLWARTILSEAPGEDLPVEVPLIRSLWLAKKGKRKIAMKWMRDKDGSVLTDLVTLTYADGQSRTIRRPILEVFEPKKDDEVEPGAVSSGSATCPVTGYTTPIKSVRAQLKARRGGASDARLFCVVTTRAGVVGRFYRVPISEDFVASKAAQVELLRREKNHNDLVSLIPNEKFSGLEPRRIPLPQYGIEGFRDCFLPRQLLTLSTFCRLISGIKHEAADITPAIQTCLAFAVDRLVDYLTSLTVWASSGEFIAHTFGRQAIPMVWEWAECQPLANGSGNWEGACNWIARVIDEVAAGNSHTGQSERVSATAQQMPNDSADAVVTDPPYYFSIPYADLSDFFYVWLRRNLRHVHPHLFVPELTDKSDEVIQNLPHSAVADRQKDREFYESKMRDSLAECRRVAKPNTVSVVVFAHTDTDAWESLLTALIGAGWLVTGSWPIDTERASRVLASRQSTLASSVHIICRPRENPDGSLREEIGEWRDVLSELPKRIHEWMPRLAAEGVVGADAIFACLGPALEVFSRYSRVEKASGEAVQLREYLEQVWAAVSTEALSMIFKDADAAGLEPDARITAMWLWTLGNAQGKSDFDNRVVAGIDDYENRTDDDPKGIRNSVGYFLEYDAARKIAQGLGINLDQSDSIVEVKGNKARLLPVRERTRHLFGNDAATATSARGRKKKKETQKTLFAELDELEAEAENVIGGELKPQAGETVLDRVHQAMILFASGRGEALRRFLVEDGAGTDARFWKLAQSFSALYPAGTDEKRWVDGVLARKKGLGL